MKGECFHKEGHRRVIKIYRQNFPFGRKSKVQFYGKPKVCMEVCDNCKTLLNKWKPA